MFKTIKQFIQEALRELGRVTWPSRITVIRMTIGVVIVSALFGLFAGLADLGITTALREMLILKGSQPAATGQNSPIQVNPGDVQVETTPAK
ncbi:preprotein translocase subunit SecE [candidate division Kazan bacterium RIFCSPHIGHO2_01_FULL_49_10]|uniref:Protein translocase subunit SecE n=1 Tax=candidate division Kazan bacterium RIFCSPLOWO2_01_FULL_48_13 TaxID=1798539 RepID=A0A1F4PPX2_UNCK3|nr:MAG: preprotein translocase subunit SecE [candidate division Kazan bacterium RIFCSPHIGHO2_01_FULL_49_10]OGB85630.1 MAG: preprotein translocase subunit SecE [candidate division Kazan bacterium RIFCSPLOWO2_01_FULL_48_13]